MQRQIVARPSRGIDTRGKRGGVGVRKARDTLHAEQRQKNREGQPYEQGKAGNNSKYIRTKKNFDVFFCLLPVACGMWHAAAAAAGARWLNRQLVVFPPR